MMPNMSGIEFYEAVLRRDPDVARRMAFMTGGAVTARVESFLHAIPNVRIDKPFETRRLLATIQELLAAQATREERTLVAE
jgi:CheY-like chemotaxis protein